MNIMLVFNLVLKQTIQREIEASSLSIVARRSASTSLLMGCAGPWNSTCEDTGTGTQKTLGTPRLPAFGYMPVPTQLIMYGAGRWFR
jgi:hypothetical protein